jgi:hypothetical protein
MTNHNNKQFLTDGLKINLFTPSPFASLTLLRRSGYAKAQSYAKAKKGCKLIFFAPLGAGVIEENQYICI